MKIWGSIALVLSICFSVGAAEKPQNDEDRLEVIRVKHVVPSELASLLDPEEHPIASASFFQGAWRIAVNLQHRQSLKDFVPTKTQFLAVDSQEALFVSDSTKEEFEKLKALIQTLDEESNRVEIQAQFFQTTQENFPRFFGEKFDSKTRKTKIIDSVAPLESLNPHLQPNSMGVPVIAQNFSFFNSHGASLMVREILSTPRILKTWQGSAKTPVPDDVFTWETRDLFSFTLERKEKWLAQFSETSLVAPNAQFGIELGKTLLIELPNFPERGEIRTEIGVLALTLPKRNSPKPAKPLD